MKIVIFLLYLVVEKKRLFVGNIFIPHPILIPLKRKINIINGNTSMEKSPEDTLYLSDIKMFRYHFFLHLVWIHLILHTS